MAATDLAGASVLVAGATGGLGAPIARLLADAGATLTLTARTADRLAALGITGAATIPLDLTHPAAPAQAVAAALDAHGQLDGVVYAAGVVAFGPLVETDDDTVDELFLLNALAPLRLLRASLGPLAEASARNGGQSFVVNLSAVVAEKPQLGMAAYTASKAALWGLDGAVAGEVRRHRVRVVDARPPHTETGLASRPIAGTAPSLPRGKAPEQVAARVVRAIVDGERDLPSSAF